VLGIVESMATQAPAWIGWLLAGIAGIIFTVVLEFWLRLRHNQTRKQPLETEEKSAAENPTVTYNITINKDNRMEVHIHYHHEKLADTSHKETKDTFAMFKPSGDIIDASNISAIGDCGVGSFVIHFDEPLSTERLVVHPMGTTPKTFKVIDATNDYVHVVFENGEPDLIALRFDT